MNKDKRLRLASVMLEVDTCKHCAGNIYSDTFGNDKGYTLEEIAEQFCKVVIPELERKFDSGGYACSYQCPCNQLGPKGAIGRLQDFIKKEKKDDTEKDKG